MKIKVVSGKNLPPSMPLSLSISSYLLLDKFHAPGWAWGVVGTILVVLWLAFFVGLFIIEPVDIFE